MAIRSKVAMSSLGVAINGLGWFLAAKFDWFGIGVWSPEEIMTASGFTAVILGFFFGYQTPDEMSPAKGDGALPLPEDVA